VSSAFWSAAHATLSGRLSGADSVKVLEKDLNKVRRGTRW
jgi:hypothetical protein